MKQYKSKYITIAGYVFIALICSIFIFQASTFVPHDFANYYFGGEFLKLGKFNSTIYFPHIFNQEITNLGYKNIFISYAPNTPFLALFFYPFAFLSLATAKIVFNVISLLLFLYSLRKLVKTFSIKPVFLFLIPLVFLIPLRNNFLFGQVYLVLFFLLSEGFLAYKKEAYIKMSLFWGLTILLKVFPVLLFGMLIFKKKYKAILYLGSVCVLLLSLSIFVNGFDVWDFYFSSVLPRSGNGEIAGEFVQNYQSVFMFLKYLFPENSTVFSMMLLLFKLALLVISYFFTKQESSSLKVFSFWLFVSLLLSPYGSTYTNLLLIFPFLYLSTKEDFKHKNIIPLFLFIGILFVPVQRFSGFNLPFSFPRLFLMILLFLFFIKENIVQVNWKKSVGFIAPVMVVFFIFFLPKEEISKAKILSKNHILTYDYKVKNKQLVYNFWSANGENKEVTTVNVQSLDTISVQLINNQVYYKNEQLTFEKGNKLKPAIINQHQLIYLSDAKKGIGFYSLYISTLKN